MAQVFLPVVVQSPPWIRRGGASGDEFIKKSHWFVSVLSLTTL
jgi:hypothetical protein